MLGVAHLGSTLSTIGRHCRVSDNVHHNQYFHVSCNIVWCACIICLLSNINIACNLPCHFINTEIETCKVVVIKLNASTSQIALSSVVMARMKVNSALAAVAENNNSVTQSEAVWNAMLQHWLTITYYSLPHQLPSLWSTQRWVGAVTHAVGQRVQRKIWSTRASLLCSSLSLLRWLNIEDNVHCLN